MSLPLAVVTGFRVWKMNEGFSLEGRSRLRCFGDCWSNKHELLGVSSCVFWGDRRQKVSQLAPISILASMLLGRV